MKFSLLMHCTCSSVLRTLCSDNSARFFCSHKGKANLYTSLATLVSGAALLQPQSLMEQKIVFWHLSIAFLLWGSTESWRFQTWSCVGWGCSGFCLFAWIFCMFVSSVRTVQNTVLDKKDNIWERSTLQHFRSAAWITLWEQKNCIKIFFRKL